MSRYVIRPALLSPSAELFSNQGQSRGITGELGRILEEVVTGDGGTNPYGLRTQ